MRVKESQSALNLSPAWQHQVYGIRDVLLLRLQHAGRLEPVDEPWIERLREVQKAQRFAWQPMG